jgi:hypothetical protein
MKTFQEVGIDFEVIKTLKISLTNMAINVTQA